MIVRLLSHYWTADDPPAAREAQIEDWISDLVEFDLDVVRDACAEWRRRDDNKRPTPGQIRKICFDEQQERRAASQRAITGPNVSGLDADAIRDWSRPDDENDRRTWQERRADALSAQKARYQRAEEWRKANPR